MVAQKQTEEGINLLTEYCKGNNPDPMGIFLLIRGHFSGGKYSAAEILVPEALKAVKKVSRYIF